MIADTVGRGVVAICTRSGRAGTGAWLCVTAAIGLVFSLLFTVAPRLDLWVSGLFTDQAGRFWMARGSLPLFLNDLISKLAFVVVVGSLLACLWALWRHRRLAGVDARGYAFVLLSVALGPGLVANGVFKEHWGRARPRQVVEFGGTLPFSPPLQITDHCATNCSFVSGDAAMAFAMLALALLAPWRWRPLAVAAALAFGTLIGAVRMLQGAHFLSDVLFAGVFVTLVVLALRAVVLEGRLGIADPVAAVAARLAGAAARGGRRVTRWLWVYLAPGLRDLGLPPPADQ